MYRNFIPEEELETLSNYVKDLTENSDFFDFRQQEELDQAPDSEIISLAEEIRDIVDELNEAINKRDAVDARDKLRLLRTTLRSIADEALTYLEAIVGQAKNILEESETIISNGNEFIAVRRRDEIMHLLEKN